MENIRGRRGSNNVQVELLLTVPGEAGLFRLLRADRARLMVFSRGVVARQGAVVRFARE